MTAGSCGGQRHQISGSWSYKSLLATLAGAKNKNWVLWKYKKCSKPLNHLPYPFASYFDAVFKFMSFSTIIITVLWVCIVYILLSLIIVAYIYMGIELTTWVWATCWELNSHFLNGYQLPVASKIGQKFLCSIPNHAGMLICTVLCKSFISSHSCWEIMGQYPPQVKKISFQSSFPCFFFLSHLGRSHGDFPPPSIPDLF